MVEATFKSRRGIDRIQSTNSKINRRRKLKTSESHTSRSLVFEIFHESDHSDREPLTTSSKRRRRVSRIDENRSNRFSNTTLTKSADD
jgi:hypothetical protein